MFGHAPKIILADAGQINKAIAQGQTMLNMALQNARTQPENGYALRDGQRYAVLH